MARTGVMAFVLVAVWATPSVGEKIKIEPGQKYVMIEAVRTKTVAAEINEVAEQGFRVLMSSADSDSGRMQIFLERVTAPPNNYNYQLVATLSAKTKEKEMNTAGLEGFRIIPNTFMSKKGMTIFNTESVVLMERAPKSRAKYEYKMITGMRSKNLEKEITEALSLGWKVIDLAYGELILEKTTE